MGVRLPRKKPRNLLLSVLYRLGKLLPLSRQRKFRLYLDLEWIFDRLALEQSFKVYPEDQHPVRTYTRDFILQRIHPSDRVLDLGCKEGYMSDYIAEKAALVVGMDLDAAAISVAKARYHRENLSFVEGEAGAYLETLDTPFDVLILSHILEHLDEPEAFLLRFKGRFRRIYIEVPDFDRYYLNQYRKDHNVALLYSDNDHVSEFDRTELRALLNACGLRIEQEEYRFGVQRIWCSEQGAAPTP